MKNYLIVGLVCAIGLLAIGFEPIERGINQTLNRGTLKGVENCISYTSSELISSEATKAKCVAVFQKPLYNQDHATGQAGPRFDQEGVGWGGSLENKFTDHVTTWVEITVSLFDDEGEERTYKATTPTWIDPLAETDFWVELPALERKEIEGVEFCDLEDTEPKSCMSWGTTGLMGVSI